MPSTWRPAQVATAVPQRRRAGAWRWRLPLAAVLALLTSGCEHAQFYGQAVRGQLELLAAREPIDRLLGSDTTSPTLQARLRVVQAARQFASAELGLPVGGRYASYVELQRPFAVWSVFATPEFSLQPLEWCYPIAGCAVYRGYFTRETAVAFAARLRRDGFDADVGGIRAYSTLGWFDDPVLSSFLALSDDDLAGLIFHETAHSLVYVADDSAFNEAFAMYVEEEGLRRWLRSRDESERIAAVAAERERRAAFARFVAAWRTRLAAEFDASRGATIDQRRQRKAALYAEMAAAYHADPHGFAPRYDRYFALPIDNARWVGFATYFDLVPAFAELHRRSGELAAFYAAVAGLSELDRPSRHARLAELVERKPGGAAITTVGSNTPR